MKTDNFDDSFKKKLDNVNSQYSDEEIDRVANYVYKNSSSVKDDRGVYSKRNVLYLVIIVIGLLTWNLIQYFHNQDLSKSIIEINKTLLAMKENAVVSKSQPELVSKSSEQKFTSSNETKELATNSSDQVNRTESGNSGINNGKNINEIQKRNKSFNKKGVPNFSQNNNERNKIVGGELADQYKNESETELNKSLSAVTNTNVKGEILTDPKVNDTIANENSLIANKAQEKKIETVSQEGIDTSKSDKFSKKLTYQIGAGGAFGNNQYGYMLLGGVTYKNKWSLLTGIKYLVIRNEKDNDEDDYNHKHGKNFKSSYVSDTLSPAHISGIDFRYSLYQIPVLLNYKVDLKKKFALLFSVGTDVDISVTKHVRYEYNNLAVGETSHKHMQLPETNIWFNNAILSATLQRQIRKFCIQLAPYYSQQIKLTNYKTQKFNYGLQLRIMYNI